jgi:hypothetical protein
VSAVRETRAARREQLLERCQLERNELIAMTATAVALAPRLRAWARVARSFHRILRTLHDSASGAGSRS